MKCKKCGFENLESAHVCRKCGATLANQKDLVFDSEEKSNKTPIIAVLGIIIVILLVVVGLFAFGVFNQPTDNTPIVTNHTDVRNNTTTEIVYVANGSGSGSNYFSLEKGNYIINVSVTPLTNNSTFYVSNMKNKLLNFEWDNNNLTTSTSLINFTNYKSTDFKIYFKDIKNWNIEIIKINEG